VHKVKSKFQDSTRVGFRTIMTNQNRIQITPKNTDKQITITNKSIEIQHIGKPVKGTIPSPEKPASTTTTGFIFLLLDCSSSMAGSKLNQVKNGVNVFIADALKQGYYIGLVKFDSHAKLIVEPCKDVSLLEKGLSTLKAYGETNMEEAIYVSSNFLMALSGQKIIVLVTDGMPTNHGDPQSSLNAGEFAKNHQIDIMAIGTDDADHDFLEQLATRSELGIKVTNEKFEQTIASSFVLLPSKFE
jgi:uncharacterized protein YegL